MSPRGVETRGTAQIGAPVYGDAGMLFEEEIAPPPASFMTDEALAEYQRITRQRVAARWGGMISRLDTMAMTAEDNAARQFVAVLPALRDMRGRLSRGEISADGYPSLMYVRNLLQSETTFRRGLTLLRAFERAYSNGRRDDYYADVFEQFVQMERSGFDPEAWRALLHSVSGRIPTIRRTFGSKEWMQEISSATRGRSPDFFMRSLFAILYEGHEDLFAQFAEIRRQYIQHASHLPNAAAVSQNMERVIAQLFLASAGGVVSVDLSSLEVFRGGTQRPSRARRGSRGGRTRARRSVPHSFGATRTRGAVARPTFARRGTARAI